MHKTYELESMLSAQAAAERIEGLLSKEGVRYKVGNLSLASTRTPIALLPIQPKLYSRSNWVGVNPFTFVSGVDVCFEPHRDGGTRVTILVNRLRAFLYASLGIAVGLMVAVALPEPAGVLFFLGFACATWFSIVPFLAGYLIR